MIFVDHTETPTWRLGLISKHTTRKEPEFMNPNVEYIVVDSLQPDPSQPRKSFSREGLARLAESLKRDGVIQPLVVAPESMAYRIVAGERRWQAAKLAGLDVVPCIVRSDLAAGDIRRLQLVENIQREDLNPLERAEAFKAALAGGMTQEALAVELGVARATIAATLQLLQLPQNVRDALSDGLSERAAVELLRLRVFDRACGAGMLDRICGFILSGRARVRTYADVRRLTDHWLAELRWVVTDGGVFGGEFLNEYEAELGQVEAWSLFHWAAWIRRTLRPDLSKLTDGDREALERAWERVNSEGETA